MQQKGKFISIEGIDGCGKSTLKERLMSDLADNYTIVGIREPGGTAISEKIRGLLLDVKNSGMSARTEAMLYAAARAQVVEEIIRPAIDEGKVVIADRFMDSTIAYQGYGRGLDIDFLKQLNHLCTGGLKPDLTILLDIDAELGQLRKMQDVPDRLEKEGVQFQILVRQGYLNLANEEDERIKVINASQDIECVRDDVLKYIKQIL